MDRASTIILPHKHRAGPLNPSATDADTTRRLEKATDIMGLAVLDSLIFNRREYSRFLETGSPSERSNNAPKRKDSGYQGLC
jgi:DNA repair protein RadC